MTTENPNAWTTAITQIEPNHVRVRGYDIAELMGNVSFGAMVYLIIRGELPDEKTGRLMDAILCSGIDHGATPPSALAARTVASTGANISAAVAAGIMCINQHHGGAMENCAKAMKEVLARVDDGEAMADAAASPASAIASTPPTRARNVCSSSPRSAAPSADTARRRRRSRRSSPIAASPCPSMSTARSAPSSPISTSSRR
jgi:citrate synthase